MNGFSASQRVVAQDVEASPPQLYSGKIRSVWSDGSTDVKWDHDLPVAAERHLVQNGFVNLHYLSCQS